MENIRKSKKSKLLHQIYKSAMLVSVLFLTISSCKKDDNNGDNNGGSTQTGYTQVNLVSDAGSPYSASRVDSHLVNAWGIAISPTGFFWISAGGSGYTTIYDRDGAQALPDIQFPSGAKPTGVIYNSTSSFMGNKFIYSSEDGKIYGWASGSTFTVLADRSTSNSVYKGLAIANNGSGDYLYVTDFKNNHIDVFDANMNYNSTINLHDSTMTAGFSPFNIYNHDGKLWVTYAKQKGPDNEDDEPGDGNGYIDIYNPDGSLDKRFASQGKLNSPWGMADAPSGFGVGNDRMLVGNFGDGRINVYASDGTFISQLDDNGTVISIDGLWGLTFPENGIPAGVENQLFFTAGPQDETHGVFGYVKKH